MASCQVKLQCGMCKWMETIQRSCVLLLTNVYPHRLMESLDERQHVGHGLHQHLYVMLHGVRPRSI